MFGAEEFLENRISWKEFCLDLEYSSEYFQSMYPDDKINKEKFSPEVFELFMESRRIVSEAYQKIDSGNKQDAKMLADNVVNNKSG